MRVAPYELEAIIRDPRNEFPREGVKRPLVKDIKYVFLTRVWPGESVGQTLREVRKMISKRGASFQVLCAWPSSFVVR